MRSSNYFDSSSENGAEREHPAISDKVLQYMDSITEKDGREETLQQQFDEMPSRPMTPEEEEFAILQSVSSERGRERIKGIMSARRSAERRFRENQEAIERLRGFIERIGVDHVDLVNNLEYSRLLGKGDESSLQSALNMLEEQRDMICKRLSVERPGVDLLSDCPGLRAAVDKGEITLEHASRLARYERMEKEEALQREMKAQNESRDAEFLAGVIRTRDAIVSYLKTRSGEADHSFKVSRLHDHLKQPGVLAEMAGSIDPDRLFSHLRFMYDNIVVPPMHYEPRMQPIRSRPTTQGSIKSRPNASLIERMGDILDGMGI